MNDVFLWWRATGRGRDVVLLPGGFGLASDYLDPLDGAGHEPWTTHRDEGRELLLDFLERLS